MVPGIREADHTYLVGDTDLAGQQLLFSWSCTFSVVFSEFWAESLTRRTWAKRRDCQRHHFLFFSRELGQRHTSISEKNENLFWPRLTEKKRKWCSWQSLCFALKYCVSSFQLIKIRENQVRIADFEDLIVTYLYYGIMFTPCLLMEVELGDDKDIDRLAMPQGTLTPSIRAIVYRALL